MMSPARARLITNISTMTGRPVTVTSVSLDAAGIQAADELLSGRGGAAFTTRTQVFAHDELQFAYPGRLGDHADLTLSETSAVLRTGHFTSIQPCGRRYLRLPGGSTVM
jgi:hypothetical protein